MATIIAPVGYSAEEALFGIERAGLVAKVVLIGGPVVRRLSRQGHGYDLHLDALSELEETLGERGVEVRVHEVDDPFDFPGWVQTLRRLIRTEVEAGVSRSLAKTRRPLFPMGSTVALDISSGPPALHAACMMAAVLEGVPVHLGNRDAGEDLWLPLLPTPYLELLGDRQRRIVKFVAEEGPVQQEEIVEKEGKAPQTISYHLRKLRDAGLLVEEEGEDGRTKVWQVSGAARVIV